jgi:hypothetical protein
MYALFLPFDKLKAFGRGEITDCLYKRRNGPDLVEGPITIWYIPIQTLPNKANSLYACLVLYSETSRGIEKNLKLAFTIESESKQQWIVI